MISKISILERYKYFFFFLVLVITKQYLRFIHPSFWGEDGYIFFKRSIEEGYTGILMPYAGYFQVFPQILSYLSANISITLYPYISLVICSIIFSYMLSQFMKTDMLWLLKSKFIGFIIAMSILFLPGQNQFLGNFANLHSILFLSCVLMLMYDLNKNYNIKHFIYFLLTGLSAGELLVVTPLILMRIFLLKGDRSYPKNILSSHFKILIIILFTSALNTYTYLTNTYSVWTQGESGLQAKIDLIFNFFPNRFFYSVFNRMFLIPIFGDNITFYINQTWQSILWIGSGFLILFSYFIYKTWSKKIYFIILSSIFTYILLILMTCLVRKGTWNTAWFGLINEFSAFQSRYMFILIPVSILAIYSILFTYLVKFKSNFIGYLVVIIIFLNFSFQNKYNFIVPSFNSNSSIESWNKTSNEILKLKESKLKGNIPVTEGNSDFVITFR